MNYFEDLVKINVNEHVETKGKLKYLSWTWAWSEIKKVDPKTKRTIYKNAQGWNYHTDGKTCWVEVGVTAFGIEEIEHLPIMDFRNQAITLAQVNSMDVNKAIQRAATKAIARHGLGLYIYAGEDLPEVPDNVEAPKKYDPVPSIPEFKTFPAIKKELGPVAVKLPLGMPPIPKDVFSEDEPGNNPNWLISEEEEAKIISLCKSIGMTGKEMIDQLKIICDGASSLKRINEFQYTTFFNILLNRKKAADQFQKTDPRSLIK